jgi:ribonuclease P/MRP protein subunit POP1
MAPPQVVGQKRKADPESKNNSSLMRKRQKGRDARAIPSQPAAAALSATGELNIAAFVKAREFEINALDKSMQKAKKGLTTRAFQGVPRSMRRRTASHNVKKVPKRLRPRAEREVSWCCRAHLGR